MGKCLKKIVSFKKSEIELYNYLESKRNASCYIKDLIEKDMKKICKPEIKKESKNDNYEFNF